MPRGTVLIAYDGSERSRRAIRVAAELLEGADVVVLHVGETALPPPPPGVPGALGPEVATYALTESALPLEDAARAVADEGVHEAAGCGLRATALGAVAGPAGTVADAIAAVADEHDVRLIVLGSHGRSPLRAALLGSVSSGVLSRTHRPVLVVPQAK